MKRWIPTLGAVTLAALFTVVAYAEIPANKEYIVRQACFSLALDIRNEDSGTTNHYERIMMANDVLTSPGGLPLRLGEIAEAGQWGTPIDWETVTDVQIKSAISGVWDHVAIAEYGDPPVAP